MRTATYSWSPGRRFVHLCTWRSPDQSARTYDIDSFWVRKPVFKVRGFQVSGDELEALIRNHPDVDEVCVLGVPDLYSGEVPVALVVLGDSAKERAEKDDGEAKKITISILKARFATIQLDYHMRN